MLPLMSRCSRLPRRNHNHPQISQITQIPKRFRWRSGAIARGYCTECREEKHAFVRLIPDSPKFGNCARKESAVRLSLTGRVVLLLSIGANVLIFTGCQSENANGTEAQAQQSFFTAAAGSPISVSCGPGTVVIRVMNNDKKPGLVVACG